jgi:spore germination cell wall hydrolase CwlJ-like protein
MLRNAVIAAVTSLAILSSAASAEEGTQDPLEQITEIASVTHADTPDFQPSVTPKLRPAHLTVPKPPKSLRGASDLLCLAVAVYHEARNQEYDGQIGVASVILNRAATPNKWGNRPCDVVRPVQFSFMQSRYDFAPIDEMDAWATALEVATVAMIEGPSPEFGDADHYHTLKVKPEWRLKMVRVAVVQDHIFYADPASKPRG